MSLSITASQLVDAINRFSSEYSAIAYEQGVVVSYMGNPYGFTYSFDHIRGNITRLTVSNGIFSISTDEHQTDVQLQLRCGNGGEYVIIGTAVCWGASQAVRGILTEQMKYIPIDQAKIARFHYNTFDGKPHSVVTELFDKNFELFYRLEPTDQLVRDVREHCEFGDTMIINGNYFCVTTPITEDHVVIQENKGALRYYGNFCSLYNLKSRDTIQLVNVETCRYPNSTYSYRGQSWKRSDLLSWDQI